MQNAATEYPNLYSAVKTPLPSNLVFAYKQNDDIWSLPNKIDISSGSIKINLYESVYAVHKTNWTMVTVWILPS